MILLRPHMLSYKNRLLKGPGSARARRLEIFIVGIVLVVMLGIYSGLSTMLPALAQRGDFGVQVLGQFLNLFFLGFIALLTFSNFISALGNFYASKDISLILATPVSRWQLYGAKFIETLLNSSWMFVVLAFPLMAALWRSLELGPVFALESVFVCALVLVIPASLGIMLATVFVNYFPLARLGDLIVLLVIGAVVTFFLFGEGIDHVTVNRSTLEGLAYSALDKPWFNSPYLPSTWAGSILGSYFMKDTGSTRGEDYLLLSSVALGSLCAMYLTLQLFFMRGISLAFESSRRLRIRALSAGTAWSRFVPERPRQVIALMVKEGRLFVRDTAQALQLALILLLTFLYLYNFRTLQAISSITDETRRWWESVLTLGNVFMGASVSSAIATRFVFPAISLEGRAYYLLRCAPLHIKDFLWAKFLAWYLPITGLTAILLVSGALAVQATPEAILVSAMLASALSIGIVGLGIGAGAVYSRFDWDSPTQVTSNFGSIVYMLLSMSIVMVSLVPSSFLFVALSVPKLFNGERPVSFYISLFCAFFLVFFLNLATARTAMKAGENRLADLERDEFASGGLTKLPDVI